MKLRDRDIFQAALRQAERDLASAQAATERVTDEIRRLQRAIDGLKAMVGDEGRESA